MRNLNVEITENLIKVQVKPSVKGGPRTGDRRKTKGSVPKVHDDQNVGAAVGRVGHDAIEDRPGIVRKQCSRKIWKRMRKFLWKGGDF